MSEGVPVDASFLVRLLVGHKDVLVVLVYGQSLDILEIF